MAHRLKLIPKMWGGGKAKIKKGQNDLVTDIMNEAATRSQQRRDAAAQERQEQTQRQFISSIRRSFGIDNNSRLSISHGRYRGQTIIQFPDNNSKGIAYVIQDTSGVQPDGSIKMSERGIPKYIIVYKDGTIDGPGHPSPTKHIDMNDDIWKQLCVEANADFNGGELDEVQVVGSAPESHSPYEGWDYVDIYDIPEGNYSFQNKKGETYTINGAYRIYPGDSAWNILRHGKNFHTLEHPASFDPSKTMLEVMNESEKEDNESMLIYRLNKSYPHNGKYIYTGDPVWVTDRGGILGNEEDIYDFLTPESYPNRRDYWSRNGRSLFELTDKNGGGLLVAPGANFTRVYDNPADHSSDFTGIDQAHYLENYLGMLPYYVRYDTNERLTVPYNLDTSYYNTNH